MKRRKPIARLLSACRRQTCGTQAGPSSAVWPYAPLFRSYEAPRAAVDRSTRFIGAESKRRGCPRLPAPPSRVTLLGRLRRPAATAPRLGAGRAARTAAPAPPPAALRGPGPADAAQEIPDLLAEFLAHELPNRGHEALLSWHPVPSRLRFGCSYSNAPSRARRARRSAPRGFSLPNGANPFPRIPEFARAATLPKLLRMDRRYLPIRGKCTRAAARMARDRAPRDAFPPFPTAAPPAHRQAAWRATRRESALPRHAKMPRFETRISPIRPPGGARRRAPAPCRARRAPARAARRAVPAPGRPDGSRPP